MQGNCVVHIIVILQMATPINQLTQSPCFLIIPAASSTLSINVSFVVLNACSICDVLAFCVL